MRWSSGGFAEVDAVIDRVQHLERRAVADLIGDEVEEAVRLVVEAERVQPPQRERRVAHPAVPVVPVPFPARCLGERRGGCRQQGAGGRVRQALQRERAALKDAAPRMIGERSVVQPSAPEIRGPAHARGCVLVRARRRRHPSTTARRSRDRPPPSGEASAPNVLRAPGACWSSTAGRGRPHLRGRRPPRIRSSCTPIPRRSGHSRTRARSSSARPPSRSRIGARAPTRVRRRRRSAAGDRSADVGRRSTARRSTHRAPRANRCSCAMSSPGCSSPGCSGAPRARTARPVRAGTCLRSCRGSSRTRWERPACGTHIHSMLPLGAMSAVTSRSAMNP